MYDITSSIVIYENDENELAGAINSFLNTTLHVKLYLVDNSPTNFLEKLATDPRVDYRFLNKNIGFGAAHNIVLSEVLEKSKYHLVLNPDVTFEAGTLESIYTFMESNPDIGQVLPKVYYKNGELQKLCKLLPTPQDLIIRRLLGDSGIFRKRKEEYELSGFDYNHILNIPNLSGCFMFLRTKVLRETGFFDTRYFMYLEDVDLTRRIHRVSKTVFFPAVSIIHGYKKESYINKVLLSYHVKSAIKYFNKWGWVWDKERKEANKGVLQRIAALGR